MHTIVETSVIQFRAWYLKLSLGLNKQVWSWMLQGQGLVVHAISLNYRPRSRGDNTFGSVRVFVCLCVCLLKHHRVFISRSIQNGWAFKMVVVSTGCAIAVDHAFNSSCKTMGHVRKTAMSLQSYYNFQSLKIKLIPIQWEGIIYQREVLTDEKRQWKCMT